MQPSSKGRKTTLQHLIGATDTQAVQETIAMRETTIASTAKPNEPDMTHVSLSDNDGEYCKVRSTPSSKQGRKRARGAVRKAEEKKSATPRQYRPRHPANLKM
jgi:hypothetical protein